MWSWDLWSIQIFEEYMLTHQSLKLALLLIIHDWKCKRVKCVEVKSHAVVMKEGELLLYQAANMWTWESVDWLTVVQSLEVIRGTAVFCFFIVSLSLRGWHFGCTPWIWCLPDGSGMNPTTSYTCFYLSHLTYCWLTYFCMVHFVLD